MKKLNYMGMGLLLCLFAAIWTGCDKPNEQDDNGTVPEKGSVEMQILDTNDNALSELYLERVFKGVFKLKNTGSSIVEWEIPTLAEDWLKCSKQSGKLAPGASERIYLTIDRSKLPSEESEAVLNVVSEAGEMQLKVRVKTFVPGAVGSDYEETAFGMSLQMVAVEGGTFEMGATAEQGDDAYYDEKPVHEVTLDGFYIGKFEVTQGQWAAVMGTTLSDIISENGWSPYGIGDDYPMYDVSWYDAQAFCTKLSELTGKTYRLPTEAEWEYAARGGQQADGTKYAGGNSYDDVAWCWENSARAFSSHSVGQKRPNGLGLYDMSGNVSEWCSDWHNSDYYGSSPSVNPQGPSSESESFRVYRGGCWECGAQDCRVSCRDSHTPDSWYYNLGFRVVCER